MRKKIIIPKEHNFFPRKKIVICGGHLTPALAVINLLKKEDWEIIFIGRKFALEGEANLSVEYKITRELGLPFISLTAGRWQRSLTRFTFFSLLKVPVGFLQSFYWLRKLKPDIILSFGGYVALPVALAGWFLEIPVVTHEQSVIPGLANKIIGFFAKKICVSWEKTLLFFPKKKTFLTGNPLRKEILTIGVKPPHLRGVKADKDFPLLYITGGSLGAHSINQLIMEILPDLLKKYYVIHQCGEAKVYGDYNKLLEARNQLVINLKEHYFLFKYIEREDVGWVFNKADLVIARAGANTVCELAALGKPAILIPLPWAGQNEQMENARLLEEKRTAIILEQKNLTGKSLFQCIGPMIQNLEEYKKKAQKAKEMINLQAGENLIKVIEDVV